MIFQNYIILDGVRYEYEAGSWTRSRPIRASRNETQNTPSFSYDGLAMGTQQITLAMNTNIAVWGASTTAQSQYSSLETTFSKLGYSMPVIFVNPLGMTYNVVPMGELQSAMASVRIYGSSGTPIMLTAQITLAEA